MKSPLLYILEVLFCSGLLLAFYRLLLVRKVSFAACRLYLVAAVVFPAVIPALDIPLYPARTAVYSLPLIATVPVAPVEVAETVVSVSAVDWQHLSGIVAKGLYAAAVLVSLGLFVLHTVRIRRLRRHSRLTDCGAYTLAENPQVATPFSFLRTVFLGDGYEGRRREIVLCHEASHVRHHHSAERIAVEFFRIFFFFNPFVWIAGRWLQEVHEWEADRDVLGAGYDLTEYRTVIFRQLFGYNPDIACGLNHSFTKKRFDMMTQFKMRRSAVLRLGAAIPVMAGMMMLCSFTTRTPDAPVAVGDRPVAEVHIGSDGSVTLNGRPISRDSLSAYVAAEREKLAESERADMEVRFVAEPDQTMRSVNIVKQALRKANALRVNYVTPSGDPGVLRMLPPDPAASDGKVRSVVAVTVTPLRSPGDTKVERVVAEPGQIPIKERNFYGVMISSSGKIMAGQPGKQEMTGIGELTAHITAFLLNASDDPSMSGKKVEEFELPDGRKTVYPVSEGVVSIVPSMDALYGQYVALQRAVMQAFEDIRSNVAQKWFGRPFGALSQAERQVVMRAVPVKVFEADPHGIAGM